MNFRLATFILLSGTTCNVAAEEADSVSLKPSFHADYTGEMQTNFKHVKLASALELGAEIPLNRHLTVELHSVSYVTTDENPLINDLQGFSNIDTDNLAFAFAVAGLSWRINGSNTLFAGIRRIDEDYFCSDVLSLFTNSSCGGFPTIFANYDIATYPKASLGMHYAYDSDAFGFQASIDNGLGHNKLRGGGNTFRFCPKSDGVCALAQAVWHRRGSNYFLGGSLHYNDHCSDASREHVRPVVWTYAEQKVSNRLSLVAAYSHAFTCDVACCDFAGIGGKYDFSRASLGLFSDYTRVDGTSEWATELTCNFQLGSVLSLQPVFHLITTGGNTRCVGVLRLGVSI